MPSTWDHGLPDEVELVAEDSNRLLELAVGLETRGLDPRRLQASRAVDEPRRCRRRAGDIPE
jgi:hypothetical protein